MQPQPKSLDNWEDTVWRIAQISDVMEDPKLYTRRVNCQQMTKSRWRMIGRWLKRLCQGPLQVPTTLTNSQSNAPADNSLHDMPTSIMQVQGLCSLKTLVTFTSKTMRAEEKALIDSGATENFIDYRTVARWKIGRKPLEVSHTVYNIDGTPNKAGAVTAYCLLRVIVGQQDADGKGKDAKKKDAVSRFYITNLGEDRLILGYPWLQHFNPRIDWSEGSIAGGPVQLETPGLKLYKWWTAKTAKIAKTNYAQEWAIAARKKEKTLTAEDVPKKYS